MKWSEPDERLAVVAADLRNAAPREWGLFVQQLSVYSATFTAALLRAQSPDLTRAQGFAQGVDRVFRLMNEAALIADARHERKQ